MKKITILFSALLLVLCLLAGCASVPGERRSDPDSTQTDPPATAEDETFVFPAGTVGSENGTAFYNDGRVTFRWDAGKWVLTENNGFPVLQRYENGLDISFILFDCIDGAAGDLPTYSADALKSRIDGYDPAKQFVIAPDASLTEKDLIGIQTGYYERGEENGAESGFLCVARAATNGVYSCVYGVAVRGGHDKVKTIRDALSAQQDAEIVDRYAADVLDGFSLLK